MEEFAAGTIGGCAGIAVGHPLDLVKVRLQADAAKSRAALSATRIIQKTFYTEGLSGFFKGMGSPLVGNAPIQALYFGTFANFRSMLHNGPAETLDSQPLSDIALAGGACGVVTSLVTGPTELVKVIVQNQREAPTKSPISNAPRYTGSFDCAWKTMRTDGVFGLCRGLGMTIMRDGPALAIYFGAYEGIKRALQPAGQSYGDLDPVRTAVAGATCGALSWVLTYPIDVVKTHVQARLPGTPRTPALTITRQLLAEGGIKIFFRGCTVATVRSIPVNAITFVVYEAVMKYGCAPVNVTQLFAKDSL